MAGVPGRRIVVVNASGEVSGAELVMLGLVTRAAERGHEVTVASPAGPLAGRLPPGVAHVELPPAGRGGAAGAARLAATAAWLGSWPGAARRVRREVGRPGTHTVVNSLLALPVVRLAGPATPPTWLVHDVIVSRRQRMFVRLGRPAGTRVVAVSEAAAAPLRCLGLAVDVRPNGVTWPVAPAPGVLHDPPVVGTLGLLTGWKGPHHLLEAVARLPGVHVEIAGGSFTHDTAYAEALRGRAAGADLAGRVRFLGPVDDALETMRGWDVFVSASTSPEAGPLTVVEAMSVGLPVVATDHGGPRDILGRGEGGVLVPPGDPAALAAALAGLLADPARRAGLAQWGRAAVAARFDRRVTLAAQYVAVMEPDP